MTSHESRDIVQTVLDQGGDLTDFYRQLEEETTTPPQQKIEPQPRPLPVAAETFPDLEENSEFNEEDRKTVRDILLYLVYKKSISIRVPERAKINTVLAELQRRTEGVRQLEIFDFRSQKIEEALEIINEKYPLRGPDFKFKHPNTLFVFIGLEYADSSPHFRQLTSLAKWGSAVVLHDQSILDISKYFPNFMTLMGEQTDRAFTIGKPQADN